MGELHELLPVETRLNNEARKIMEETLTTFTKKSHLFEGSERTFKATNERDIALEGVEEHDELSETVAGKLAYTFKHLKEAVDATFQRECTNQDARASVMLPSGEVIESCPATFLLGMESMLKKIRALCQHIPTLQPNVRWVKDHNLDSGGHIVRAAEPEIKIRTRREKKFITVAPPTKEHKAQVEVWDDDVPIGQYITQRWSGMITPSQKSNILFRIDELIDCVVNARCRANKTEVVKGNVCESFLSYIFGGISEQS